MVSMTEKTNSRVGAIILAAGKSTRMGEPKQLLRLGESTVLGVTLDNIRKAGVDEIVLVLGSFAETIRQRCPASTLDGLKVVVNEAYDQGMASSLREGLFALHPQIDATLIVLADQPFIRPETFGQIVDRYRRSDAQIVIPTYKGFRGNPVLLDRSVFPEIMALSGDIGCRAIFGSHLDGIVKAEVEDVGILLDIDNKADYERLQRFGQSKQEDERLIEAATSEARLIPGLEEPGAEDRRKRRVDRRGLGTGDNLACEIRQAVELHGNRRRSSGWNLRFAFRGEIAEYSRLFSPSGNIGEIRSGGQPRQIRR